MLTEDAPIKEPAADNAALASSVRMNAEQRTVLASKTAERLAAVFGDKSEKAEESGQKTEEEQHGTDVTDQSDEASGDAKEKSEVQEEPTDETATNKEEAEAAVDDKTPTLPDSFRRSLKSYGWEDKEIDKNLKLLGADFINTAAKIHSNRNEEVSRWADAGRAARQQTTTEQKTELQPLKALDVKALEEHYGKDQMVQEIAGPVNAMIQQINAMLPLITSSQQNAQNAEVEKLSQQIEGFFGDKKLDSYREFYGDSSGLKTLTETHTTARNKVLEMADALVAGARVQGRKLSFGEAMSLAHDSVSGDFKEKTIRTTIKTTMQKREKGISLQPSSRSKAALPAATGDKTRAQLEKDTKARLRAVFK